MFFENYYLYRLQFEENYNKNAWKKRREAIKKASKHAQIQSNRYAHENCMIYFSNSVCCVFSVHHRAQYINMLWMWIWIFCIIVLLKMLVRGIPNTNYRMYNKNRRNMDESEYDCQKEFLRRTLLGVNVDRKKKLCCLAWMLTKKSEKVKFFAFGYKHVSEYQHVIPNSQTLTHPHIELLNCSVVFLDFTAHAFFFVFLNPLPLSLQSAYNKDFFICAIMFFVLVKWAQMVMKSYALFSLRFYLLSSQSHSHPVKKPNRINSIFCHFPLSYNNDCDKP